MGSDLTGFDTNRAGMFNGGGFMRENFPRFATRFENLTSVLTTQVMTSVAMPLIAGDVVTTITFVTGTQAASVPTNWWYALYSTAATPALIGQTADQTTTAMAANTAFPVALVTPFVVQTSGVHYVAIMVKATTVPDLQGYASTAQGNGAVVTGQKIITQTSGSALTATAPATIATPTTTAKVPYCVVS